MRFILILASLSIAGSVDSLAWARFRADSAQVVALYQHAAHADSVAWATRIQAQTVRELALRNLALDTAKTK